MLNLGFVSAILADNDLDRLHHIHLKPGRRSGRETLPRQAQPRGHHGQSAGLPLAQTAGFGRRSLGAFFAALTDVRYRGPVCIEVEDKAYEGSPDDVRTAILTARNYLSQFLAS